MFLPLLGFVLFAVVAYGTMAKTKWGVNWKPVHCPCCGAQPPRRRIPANAQQAKWGGYTCAACGTEMDKWGRQAPV